MRRCIGLSLLLASPIACFSEPPGTSTSSDGTTSGTSSSSAAVTEENGETSISPEPSGTEGSGSTGPTGQTSIGGTTDVTTGVGSSGSSETGEAPDSVLYDLYAAACDDGTWTAASQGVDPSEPPCFENMGAPEEAGAIRKPEPGTLILELPHAPAGFLQGAFVLPPRVTDQTNVRLQFGLRCAHPTMGACSVDSFQVLVYPFKGTDPSSAPVDQSVSNGPLSTVDVELQLGGPNDELVIAIFTDSVSPGQAIELIEPRIVLESR